MSEISDGDLRLLEACGVLDRLEDPCEYCGRSDIERAAAVDAALQSGWHAGLDEGNERAKAADAAGYARAMGEVDAACVRLSEHDEFEQVTIMRVGPDYAPLAWTAEATPKTGETLAADGATPTAAILAAVADDLLAAPAPIDTSAWTEADPPALVNGGPATDALDDGR